MATKNDPGEYDCYAKAEPDEPMFVLLARDPHAPETVRRWANTRSLTTHDPAKIEEARSCADAMEQWVADRERNKKIRTIAGEIARLQGGSAGQYLALADVALTAIEAARA